MKSLSSVLVILTGLFLVACASKEQPKVNLSLAGNRQMGIAVRKFSSQAADKATEKKYFEQLLRKAITHTYAAKIVDLNLEEGSLLESPENLYQIGKNSVDDLFVFDINISGNFQIPAEDIVTTSPETEDRPPEEPELLSPENIELSVSIYNGANLRAVNIFSSKTPIRSNKPFEKSFLESFQKSSIGAFPNPNIYPKADPKHFADLLFNFAEVREKENSVSITCDDAPDRLKYFSGAKQLYDMAIAKGSSRAVGAQSESHQLTTRQSESAQKAKIVDDCIADQKKTFEFSVNYGSIVGTNQEMIQKAIQDAHFEPLLKQYTSKPVSFRFQVDTDGKLNLFIDLRFDRVKYRAWTMNRIPQRIKNFQILSLDPYYALMQKIILLKGSIPETAPVSLRSGFENMRVLLNLTTLINGEVSFAVDGKVAKDRKHIDMAYPNAVYISLPSFDRKLIQNRDVEIFREKGWIALGNCKTLEGAKTEDGLIYDFFGLPCQ